MVSGEFIDTARGVFIDPSLGIVMRNSAEYPSLYVSKCGMWLFNTNHKNFLKRYYRNKQFKYLKCCCAKYYIHRLVAHAWVFNPCPTTFRVVDHMDHDTQNNRAENLRWVTRQLNCVHRKVKGFKKVVRKNGAVFYKVRSQVRGANPKTQYFGTRDAALQGARVTRDANFMRIYQEHLDAWAAITTTHAIYNRAPHHVLWSDGLLDPPEGAVPSDSGAGGRDAGGHALVALHDP